MFKYDNVVILKSDIKKYQKDFFLKKVKQKINVINIDDLGLKNLAYEIRGYKQGYYIVITFKGNSYDVKELETLEKQGSIIIKYLTIKTDIIEE